MKNYIKMLAVLLITFNCSDKQAVKTITFNLDVSPIIDQIDDPSTVGVRGNIPPLQWDSIFYLEKRKDNIFSITLPLAISDSAVDLVYQYVYDQIEWENWEKGGARRMLVIDQSTTSEKNDRWGEVIFEGEDVYSAPMLRVLQPDSEAEKMILAQDYKGVTTDGDIQEGLFEMKKTGISTEGIYIAVRDFLHSLTDEQRQVCTFPVGDQEWQRWSNIDAFYYTRKGISLEDLNSKQKMQAITILKETLSLQGFRKASDIMKMEKHLSKLTNHPEFLGDEKYWFSFMGEPSQNEPWGWQIDGHHLVINAFILGDQLVMTPTFMGSEPTFIAEGENQGLKTFKDEELLGLQFYQSLSEDQKKIATLWDQKLLAHNQGESYRDNAIIPYAGINWKELADDQKSSLINLIGEYIGNIKAGHSEVKMEEVKEKLDETYFAWIGADSDTSVFYYRIHSPVTLIEFDHQRPVFLEGTRPSRKHIHTVVRTPNGNDYGKDLLKQHLEQHHHIGDHQ